jgi:MoaA/NifB/PqqE/SkfB family radical SAM enzyme
MIKQISYLLYGINYLIQTKIFRKEIPFIGGLVINESCNLKCKHCRVSNRKIPDLSYKDVENGLRIFYEKGIRSVFIEGGEPFLWKSDDKKLEDVINLARKIGFKAVSIYTNGTFPIKTSADTVFVSLDGLKETNDKLRGKIYDKVMSKIKQSKHPSIIINYTINQQNHPDIEQFCQEIAKINQIKGVFFYFHTPYYGKDKLFVNLDEKMAIIKRIFKLKKQGHKILNSTACLNGVYKDNWKRPSKICYVYADNKLYQCCRAFGNDEVCKNCGYLGYPEIIYILKLRPTAIYSALSYLPRS